VLPRGATGEFVHGDDGMGNLGWAVKCCCFSTRLIAKSPLEACISLI
jgi:hypothetical protein